MADLVTTEKDYETAIETALGGSIQNVVTDSEQTAKQLIEYLKKNRYGRVTFLPLTSIGGGSGFSRPEALKEPGVIGLASELVHVKPEYQVLAKYLLGRVVVADTIDHAISLAKKYKYTLRIVTLEGELLSAGGSMTGGAFKNSSNLLGRKREIEELEAVCKKALSAADSIEKEQKLNEGLMTEKQEELEELKNRRHQVSLVQNTHQMSVSQLEDKKEEIRESYQDLNLENRQLEAQLREIEETKKKLEQAATQLTAQNEETNSQIEQMAVWMDEDRKNREEAARGLEEIRLEAAALKQKVDFVKENIRRVETELKKLKEEKEELEAGSSASGEAVSARQKEIRTLKGRNRSCRGRKRTAGEQRKKPQFIKGRKGQPSEGIFSAGERNCLSGQASWIRSCTGFRDRRKSWREKQESQINYMWNEYELTYSTALPLKNPELTVLTDVRKGIEQLKASIRALGNVNVNAIEDYREISERYEFMKNQHEDLVQAEAALLQIIEELDTGIRRQFQEKFREIRQEFDRVFRELFWGRTRNSGFAGG